MSLMIFPVDRIYTSQILYLRIKVSLFLKISKKIKWKSCCFFSIVPNLSNLDNFTFFSRWEGVLNWSFRISEIRISQKIVRFGKCEKNQCCPNSFELVGEYKTETETTIYFTIFRKIKFDGNSLSTENNRRRHSRLYCWFANCLKCCQY